MTLKQSLGILIGLACLATAPFLFGYFYAIGDMRDVTIPLELFFQQELRAGRLPTWNPDVSFGHPVLAAAQIGVFYPPLLIGRLLLPITVYLPFLWWLHIVATGIGMLLLLRRLSFNASSAFFGAIVWMFSAFIWQHTTHLNIILALSYIPWHLLATHVWVHNSKHYLRNIAAGILLFGLPLLIGQFQIQAMSMAVCTVYAITESRRAKKSLRSTAPVIVSVAAGAFLLAAVQLLPTAELVQYSSRATEGNFTIEVANQHSFPLYHLPTLVFPRFFGADDTYWGKRLEIEYGIFFGTIPLILSIIYIINNRSSLPYHVRWFTWLAAVSFLLALGSASPFRLLGIEPTLGIFSAPARWLVYTTLAMSGISAAAFQYILPQIKKKTVGRLCLGLIGLIVIGNVGLWILPQQEKNILPLLQKVTSLENLPYYQDKIHIMVTSAVNYSISLRSWFTFLPLVALGIFWYAAETKHLPQAIIIATALECLLIAGTTTPLIPWSTTLSPPATTAILPTTVTQESARIYSLRDGGDNGGFFTDPRTRANQTIRTLQRELLLPLISSQFGIAGIEWPASLNIQAIENAVAPITESGDYNELGNFAVGALLTPHGYLPKEPQATTDTVSLYTIPTSPRAEFITTQGEHIALTYTTPTPASLTFTIPSAEAGTVLIRDTYYPNWQAVVDGVVVPVKSEEPFFRSVAIPPGSTQVDMQYNPQSLTTGIIISTMTALLCCVMLMIPNKKHI